MLKEIRKTGYRYILALIILLSVNQNTMAVTNNIGLSGSASILDLSTSAPDVETNVKLKNSNNITNSKRTITISLRDSDIKQVLRMIADKAGMNIIFHESVSDKKVTLDLKNVTLDEAFNFVLSTGELNYYVEDKTIIVASADATQTSSFAKQYLTTFPIKYVNASSVASFLNDNVYSSGLKGLSNIKIATSNPRTNEVMIFGTKTDSDVARKVIAKLDTKPLMNNFKVVHTTPKQMADFICKSLFADQDSPEGEDEADSDSEVLELSIGGGSVACKAKIEDEGGSDDGNAIFKSQPATIIYMEQAGEVGIYGGSYEQAKMVEDFIARHDKKQTMAFIELNIIELNETGSNEFNTAWNIATPFANLNFTKDGGLGFGTINVLSASSAGWNWLQTNEGGVNAALTLNWLIKDGKGRSIANPKIMTTNGQKSTIDLTSDYVSKVTTQTSTNTLTSQPIITKTYDVANDNGLKIEITPFISPEGYVSMNIKPEYAAIKQKIYGTSSASPDDSDLVATLLQRRDLELNNIRIKDGETLILAGFVSEAETQTSTKFPILGDLPLIGSLFRSSNKELTKEEMVIMITPHIVYGDDHYDSSNSNIQL